jgi:hypothetical protein
VSQGQADANPAGTAGEPLLADVRLMALAATLAMAAIVAAAIILRFYDLAANPGA